MFFGSLRASLIILVHAVVAAMALSMLLPGIALTDDGIRIPLKPERPRATPEKIVDLTTPIKDLLTGRAWLITEGMDPGLTTRPGWDPLVRMDWGALDKLFIAPDVPASGAASGTGTQLSAPGAAVLVPFRDPAPAFSRDLLITRDYSHTPFQTEPHIAVNPNDPSHAVVGVIDYNFPTVTAYVTLNGGETWQGPHQVPFLHGDRVSGGDPVLAFDSDGTVYFTSISIGIEEFTFGPIVTYDMVSSIVVAHSKDGGFTWPDTISVSRSRVRQEDLSVDRYGRLRGVVTSGFLDKPWLAIGPHPGGDREVIYLTYTSFNVVYGVLWIDEIPSFAPREVNTTIELVRSEDGGMTWSEPKAVSPVAQQRFGEQLGVEPGVFTPRRVVQGSQPVVDPNDGTVYVAWLDSTDDGSMKGIAEIHVARSEDGGRTFSTPEIAATFNEIGFRPRNAMFRYWGAAFPQMAIGPEGELYIVYVARPPDRPRDDGDVYLVRSLDRGKTWTWPRRLNDDDGDSLQFFPAVAVGPDGVVHVMWGDMRDDPSQTRYHIYYTRSVDGGDTWGFELEDLGLWEKNARVTDFASNPIRGFPHGLFIGDYFAIEATAEDVYMVWADTRLGEFGSPNQKIAFARQRAIRSPDIFISPPAGPAGQQITVQGHNYQPNMNVFIQVEDAVVASARTDERGHFTTRLFMPITGEGAQSFAVFDESGNRASTSFYTEFGFGTIEALQAELLDRVELYEKDQNQIREGLDEVRTLLKGQATVEREADALTIAPWVFLALGLVAMTLGAGGAWVIIRWRNNR